MANPILQGLLGGSLILQGYGGLSASPSTPDTSHVILQGFAGGSLILQGFGGFSASPSTPDDSHVVLQGYGGGLLILQGYGGSNPFPPVNPATLRDTEIFAEIVRLLTATGQFGSVWLCAMDEYQRNGAEDSSFAFVDPQGWTEDTDGDDEDGPRERRDVTWSLVIVVKDEDPERRNKRLDQLANVAANTLNGVSYLGQTIFPLSRLVSGRYSATNHPFKFMEITGKFTVHYDGYDGHDESDVGDLFL